MWQRIPSMSLKWFSTLLFESIFLEIHVFDPRSETSLMIASYQTVLYKSREDDAAVNWQNSRSRESSRVADVCTRLGHTFPSMVLTRTRKGVQTRFSFFLRGSLSRSLAIESARAPARGIMCCTWSQHQRAYGVILILIILRCSTFTSS